MTTASSIPIDFTIGSRRLFSVQRLLSSWAFSLEDVLADEARLAPPEPGSDGLRILSAPNHAIAAIASKFPDHLIGGRQDYRRHYIDMAGSYDDYLTQFSGKTRSTLRRKARKLAKEVGDAYRLTEHRTPAEVESFLDAAIPLSEKTYQARLLDAGLPDTPKARTAMLEAAEDDRMRGFLLHASDGPIAYLSLPISGNTLIYAHLGYDPAWSRLSPGTVLQMEALERLFAEQRYRYFDFTEGEGAHKTMFGTDSVLCSSFVLLEPTLANRALLGARAGFDTIVGQAKNLAERSGALARVRSALRA
ncbi:GNAT family N-acetyltransferase [uncultured Erythrobacter sp.]|uniref:GNAT family N-acetyltransferase n=1 Tax=uncultured Erythrobacter sp. TaxID=263913 RepID=UPI00263645BD|nr:GNAT family N-acetyltransferase [uncultured Erythrobacter sp.]